MRKLKRDRKKRRIDRGNKRRLKESNKKGRRQRERRMLKSSRFNSQKLLKNKTRCLSKMIRQKKNPSKWQEEDK